MLIAGINAIIRSYTRMQNYSSSQKIQLDAMHLDPVVGPQDAGMYEYTKREFHLLPCPVRMQGTARLLNSVYPSAY